MSERGADFLIGWVAENVTPDQFPTGAGAPEARVKADECLAAAEAQGLSRAELEAEVGPLADYMKVMMSTPPENTLNFVPQEGGATLH